MTAGGRMTDNAPRPETASGFDLNRPTIIALLYLASFLTGITALIGLVLAYVWKNEPHEPWERSHYSYHIRSFWYGLIGSLICGILTLILIGLLGFVVLAVWLAVRTVLALLKAQRREPIPDPETLFW
jgi:uncharacterized membrane protein